jgi:hypothetical protein
MSGGLKVSPVVCLGVLEQAQIYITMYWNIGKQHENYIVKI